MPLYLVEVLQCIHAFIAVKYIFYKDYLRIICKTHTEKDERNVCFLENRGWNMIHYNTSDFN